MSHTHTCKKERDIFHLFIWFYLVYKKNQSDEDYVDEIGYDEDNDNNDIMKPLWFAQQYFLGNKTLQVMTFLIKEPSSMRTSSQPINNKKTSMHQYRKRKRKKIPAADKSKSSALWQSALFPTEWIDISRS